MKDGFIYVVAKSMENKSVPDPIDFKKTCLVASKIKPPYRQPYTMTDWLQDWYQRQSPEAQQQFRKWTEKDKNED